MTRLSEIEIRLRAAEISDLWAYIDNDDDMIDGRIIADLRYLLDRVRTLESALAPFASLVPGYTVPLYDEARCGSLNQCRLISHHTPSRSVTFAAAQLCCERNSHEC